MSDTYTISKLRLAELTAAEAALNRVRALVNVTIATGKDYQWAIEEIAQACGLPVFRGTDED